MSFRLPVSTAGIRLPRSMTHVFPVGEKGFTNVWIYKHAWIYKQSRHLSPNRRLHTSTVLSGVADRDKQPCLLCVLETFPAAEKPARPCMDLPWLC